MLKKLFLALFIATTVTSVGCKKDPPKDDDKSGDEDKKKGDDDDDKGSKKKKKSSDDDDDKGSKKKKKGDDDDSDKKKKGDDDDSAKKKADDTASADASTGIDECDAYVKFYKACMLKSPGAKADTIQTAVDSMTKGYKAASANPAAKKATGDACTKALTSFKTTAKSICPTVK